MMCYKTEIRLFCDAEKSIRAISLLKEVAVEISLYSTGSGDSSADVIVKYRNLMLGFTVAAGSRCMYLHRSVQSVQGALHPPHCNEIISSMSVLSASLECLLTWCDSVLSVATSGADIIAMDEEDGIRNRQLTTAADILEADARSEVHSVAHHLSAATAYCDIIDSVTVSSMLCEVLLPLVIGISSCCSGRQCEPAVATASWESTLYSLAASSAEHITSLLLCLFKPWTGRYLLDQSQKISSTAATGDAAAIAALAEVYGICHMGTIMVSSLAVFWESMLGIQARCFVKMASVWSLQGAGVSEKDFYAQVVTHLLGRDLHCRLLWSDQAVFSETHFKIPSPFLISLIELTIFICEKQSVR